MGRVPVQVTMAEAEAVGPRTTGALRGHQGEVYCVCASDSAPIVITGSEDGTARVWDVRSCKTVRAFKAFGGETVNSAVFKPGDEHTVACAAGCGLFLFDLRMPGMLLREACTTAEQPAAEEINQLSWDSSGQRIATADDAGVVCVYDSSTLAQTHRLQRHSNICSSAIFVPSGGGLWTSVVSGGLDSVIAYGEVGPEALYRSINLSKEHAESGQMTNPPLVHHLALSHDGNTVAAALGNCSIGLIDVSSGDFEEDESIEDAHLSSVCQVEFPAWDPVGEFVLSGGNDGRLALSSLECDSCVKFDHQDKINWLTTSRDVPAVVFVADQTSVVTLRALG